MALLPLLGFASIPVTSTPLCPRRIRDVENILGDEWSSLGEVLTVGTVTLEEEV